MQTLYTIWVVPPMEIRDTLQQIVTDLSTKYSSPDFEPHMTLLGNVDTTEKDMLQKAQELASQLKQFPLTLGEISFSTTYFQSVFVRIRSTAAIMNANVQAKKVYKTDNSVFMPHISLLYGDHTMEEREKIASDITLPKDLRFTVDTLVVVPSTQDPSEWHHIAEIALH